MGCPSHARNRACALPSPSPFHYVIAKKVPAMQLAAHAKSSTSYAWLYGRKFKFFRFEGYCYYYAASSAINYLPRALIHSSDLSISNAESTNQKEACGMLPSCPTTFLKTWRARTAECPALQTIWRKFQTRFRFPFFQIILIFHRRFWKRVWTILFKDLFMILRFATLQTLELVHLLVQELMRNAGDQWKKTKIRTNCI